MKFLKYLVYSFSFLLLLSIGALVYMFLRLPSPHEIAQKIPGSKASPQVKVSANTNDIINKEVTTQVSANNDTVEDQLKEKMKNAEELTAEEQKKFDDILGEQIFNFEKPISETCDNLAKAESSQFLEKDFIKSFQKTFGTDTEDPFLQAFLAPLKKATRFPKMRNFFHEVSLYKDQNKNASILDKGHFYLKALDAVREIKSKKEELNTASDRAYRLFILAKVVQKKPELVNDSSVKDFCYQLQNTIENTTETDPAQENAEFLKFLNYAGLESSDVGYNPGMKTDFKIDLDGGSLKMSLGWLGNEMSRQ